MGEEVKLNRIGTVLESFDYPLDKDELEMEVADVTVRYADGKESLADVVRRINEPAFGSADDLEAEIMSNVSVGAVGEPGQSEGEG